MIVEIDISPRAVRMLKTLGYLTGKKSEEITQEVGQLLEDTLVERIMSELQIEGRSVKVVSNFNLPQNRPPKSVTVNRDVTEISDGLGDEDPAEPEEIPPSEELSLSGGLSDRVLEEDMKVEDPEREAKVDAPTFGEDILAQQSEEGGAETLFSEMAGIGESPWALRRKKRPTQSKGKVTPLMGEPT